MNPEENRLIIRGVLDEIEQAREFVVDKARYSGLNETAIHNCELAVDEMCTNIIEHAYQMQGESKSIQLICQTNPPFFDITLIDEGPPFDPLSHVEPNPKTPLENRGEGGWGIYFVKKVMDTVSYQRRGIFNYLLMRKRLIS